MTPLGVTVARPAAAAARRAGRRGRAGARRARGRCCGRRTAPRRPRAIAHGLASRELGAGGRASAGDDVGRSWPRHAESIQRVLAHQLRSSPAPARRGERAELRAAPRARRRDGGACDCCSACDSTSTPRWAPLGSLPLPRLLLQQVVQNLILNAAEAMRDAGGAHGYASRIAGLRRSAPGTARRCAALRRRRRRHRACRTCQRIFEKGFTTKSRETNSASGCTGAPTRCIAARRRHCGPPVAGPRPRREFRSRACRSAAAKPVAVAQPRESIH